MVGSTAINTHITNIVGYICYISIFIGSISLNCLPGKLSWSCVGSSGGRLYRRLGTQGQVDCSSEVFSGFWSSFSQEHGDVVKQHGAHSKKQIWNHMISYRCYDVMIIQSYNDMTYFDWISYIPKDSNMAGVSALWFGNIWHVDLDHRSPLIVVKRSSGGSVWLRRLHPEVLQGAGSVGQFGTVLWSTSIRRKS